MEVFRFLKFPVYIDSKLLFKDSISTTKQFSREYWELGDQWRRAILSVCLNIAEGSGKYSDKEFYRHLEIAQGSITEVYAYADIAFYCGLLTPEELDAWNNKALSISRQLGGLEKRLHGVK